MIAGSRRPNKRSRAVAERVCATEAPGLKLTLVGTLQTGLSEGDADLYDSTFAEDVLWGSPYGETLTGFSSLNTIHRSLMSAPDENGSRYEVVRRSRRR